MPSEVDATWPDDGGLFPDCEPPIEFTTDEARGDFLARLCSAWDFGHLPDPATIRQVRDPAWRDVVERCRLLTSPAYHLLRRWHDLRPQPYLGQRLAYIVSDPNLPFV